MLVAIACSIIEAPLAPRGFECNLITLRVSLLTNPVAIPTAPITLLCLSFEKKFLTSIYIEYAETKVFQVVTCKSKYCMKKTANFFHKL